MKYSFTKTNTTLSQHRSSKPWVAARSALNTPYLRTLVVGVVVVLAALFMAAKVANAGVPSAPISAVKSPITNPISITLDCNDGWNPNCQPTATSNIGASLRSFFYIDGRFRGAANVVYNNVCLTYRLRDGRHTAKVSAVDALGNSARIGPVYAIECDRTGPFLATNLRFYRGAWYMNPIAIDRASGVATKTLTVDGTAQTWKVYSNVCTSLTLTAGTHTITLQATDNAGNASTLNRSIKCP
jgi:hypothetical protein